MGKSKSIQAQQVDSEDFNKYIEAMNKSMEKKLADTTSVLDEMAKEHYAKFDDNSILMQGKYSHFSTTSEWSLASINALVKLCKNALFGSALPDGSEQPQEVKQDVSASIMALKSRELYIANSACDIIQGVMGSFSNSTSASIQTKIDAKPLAPGLMLFIGVMYNTYEHKEYFKNEKIMQSMITFKVYYSIKEGEMQSKLSDLEAYENQKVALRLKLDDISKKIIELDVGKDGFKEDLAMFRSISDLIKDMMKDVTKEIQLLSANSMTNTNIKVDNTMKEVDEIVNSIQNRWNAIYKVHILNK